MILFHAETATAADFEARAAAGAWAELAAEVDAAVAEAPTKRKRARALEGLGSVHPRVDRAIGADLVLGPPESLGCAWDGSVRCVVRAAAHEDVEGGAFGLVCRSALGVRLPLATTSVRDGATMTWAAQGVEACWRLGLGALSLEPVGDGALEGIGEGTDLIPPERAFLSKVDAEARIEAAIPGFQACLRTTVGDPAARSGGIELAYHIGPTGVLDRVEVARATITDPALTACVVERFRKLTFPPPNGGFEEGVFPLEFQDAAAAGP